MADRVFADPQRALEIFEGLVDLRLREVPVVDGEGVQRMPSSTGDLGDLYAESGQTLQGSFSAGWLGDRMNHQKLIVPEAPFSAVSKPNFASKYSLESSRRDLHNALLITALESIGENWGKKNAPGPKHTLEKMKRRSAGASTRYLVLQRN